MRGGTTLILAGLLGVGAACGFDSSGQGSASGSLPSGGGPSTGPSLGQTTGDTSGATIGTIGTSIADGTNDATNGGDDPGTSDDSDDTTSEESSSGAPGDPCENPAPVTIVIDLVGAPLDPPMSIGNVPAVGDYAYSEASEQGGVGFEFQVPCEDEFRIWGYVHDPAAGFSDFGTNSDPDSYLVAYDNDADMSWYYGCQLYAAEPEGGPTWSWVEVRQSVFFCIIEDFRRTLSAGTHTFHVTNLEPGTHMVSGDEIGNVAAITSVVISSDPGYSP